MTPAQKNGTKSSPPEEEIASVEVYLGNQVLAGFLAWLWPGGGHLYQGRKLKGWIFMSCVLVNFAIGIALSGSHAVYAAVPGEENFWRFACQAGAGGPTFPAFFQRAISTENGHKGNYFVEFMAPPIRQEGRDDLMRWQEEYAPNYDIAILFVMVAGLLNYLAIFDAVSGPVLTPIPSKKGGKT
ncbi:MAG: hypothetical protein MPJ24_02630 [Pirellulaceae bacterium]|nr:hypothetical protein [Pirellulaceae bacterium]